jgi:Domain of unknown function (DUF4126)
MNPIETLGLALGAGFSSGLNLYATIATLGLLQRFGVIHLPEQLQVLAHPWVLGIAIALYVIEFLADKIPFVDTVWDAIHTVIRPPAAALLAYGAAGAAPPFSNWALSLGEDALAVWLTWLATVHPTATIVVVAILLVIAAFLLFHLFRFLRRAVRRLLEA